ncbi:hypothetical protein AMK59_4339 [Oryctes borbonicus]|uniref:Serpin domain-containing protein n=1 Tax=Oryctes borbonicus TaxID=1629725 RepID=A0A0T6B4I3_9SCAR|nr:hypothetical protein AMK59_4339 [Oryctes borbonicus]
MKSCQLLRAQASTSAFTYAIFLSSNTAIMNFRLLLLLVASSKITSAEPIFPSINSFANRLYNVLPKKDNLVFSPLSLHDSLSIAYEGAAGNTASSIRNALNLSEPARSYRKMLGMLRLPMDICLEVASRIFIADDVKLKKAFRSILNDFFSDVQNINFTQTTKAAEQINYWVKATTHNKINQLIEETNINEDSRALLLSAVYFKGEWMRKFPRAHMSEFYVTETETIRCLTMEHSRKAYYGENENLDVQILRIPYKDNRFAFVLLLPRTINGLAVLEEKLKDSDLAALALMTTKQRVRIVLPKFQVESSFSFNAPLKQLGFSEIFSNGANFTKMVENEDLKVDEIIQKAVIDFNEVGTEVTAANAAAIVRKSAERFVVEFKANHPFIFYITFKPENESDASTFLLLFMGKVTVPVYLQENPNLSV